MTCYVKSESAAPVKLLLLFVSRFVGVKSSPSWRHEDIPEACRNQLSSLKGS